MKFTGSIDGVDLAGVFQMFESQSLTGTFTVESGEEKFIFEICNGLLGNSHCKSRNMRRRINRFLYWAIGSKQNFRDYLVPTSGNPFRSLYRAHESGFLKRKDFIKAYKYFRQEMFLEIFRKARGHCDFNPHDVPAQGPALTPINHLLMESMKVIDDLKRSRKDYPPHTVFRLTDAAIQLIDSHPNPPSPFERPAFHLAEKMRKPLELEPLIFHSFLHRDHIIRILSGMKKKGWILIEESNLNSPTLSPMLWPQWATAVLWSLSASLLLWQLKHLLTDLYQ